MNAEVGIIERRAEGIEQWSSGEVGIAGQSAEGMEWRGIRKRKDRR
jgi:hypothetical protein